MSSMIFLNSGYTFNLYIIYLLLICISELKCCEKQNDIAYNVGYLSFIDE